MDQEKIFYKNLKEILIGAKAEGKGRFIDLIKTKSKYYDKLEELIKNDIENALKKYPSFKSKLEIIYSFFSNHIAENGSIYSRDTYNDPILFIKTQPLYYVKTDKLFKSKLIEINNTKLLFDASTIENKKNNEKRTLTYKLKEIKEDKTVVFNVYYEEKPKTINIKETVEKLKKHSIHIEEKDLKKAFKAFEREREFDFFLNKKAKSFLKEQFNRYICQKLFENNNKPNQDDIAQIQTLREITYKIIDFVAHFEEEIIKIWNKPKQIKNINYVITLDRLEKFGEKGINTIRKLLTHKNTGKQIKEWKDLRIVSSNFSIDNIIKENRLSNKYKFLPIDTRYFKDLEKDILNLFDDLENTLDGWLIKSESYQALNTFLPKFKEKIQTIYIDPPFNLESLDQFHYRTNYKDSTWTIFLENRLRLARDWLNEKGSIFVRCDHNGNWIVRLLMDEIFGKENFRNEIIISRTRAKQQVKNQFIQQTESLFFYSKTPELLLNEIERPITPKWHPLLHFPRADCKPRTILGEVFYPPRNRRWALSQERINKFESKGKIRINKKLSYADCKGNKVNGMPELLYDTETIGNEWLDIPGYSQAQHFPTENSEALLKRVIESTSNEGDLVMDFFLGSGTAIAVAHKLRRKWIGVEMGEHFYSVALPRMKRVLAYDKSGISKEKDVKEKYSKENTGGFFVYLELEQFEEALDNVVINAIKI